MNMSNLFLEIIELADGQIALRKADSNEEPIMRVSFSEDVREQLNEECIDVAKVMLTAGIHMISDLNVKASTDSEATTLPLENDREGDFEAESEHPPRIIH